MLGALDLTKILVLDIETVPQYPAYEHLPDRWKDLWGKKAQLIKKEEHHGPEHVYNRAGIYAEFGKIVCISCGFFSSNGRGYQFRVKSFYNDDEAVLLKEFCALLDRHFNDETSLLCAHNGKEFDYPYISRRCVINKVPLPAILNLAGKKPWQVNHLDTMELWKFGDYKSYTSLDLLAASMDIPTPKDDMDGSQVGNVYWVEKDLERIRTYCQKDIITVARLLLHFSSHSTLEDSDIVYI
jgi:predicted PolB exonuclease-like 3'-5' exonuclease